MKKATAILLLFLFLFTNSGMAVNVHYCKGKITSIKFFDDDEHGCKCGKKPMKRNCCKDKTVVFKAKIDPAKVNQFSFKIALPQIDLAHSFQMEITAAAQLQHFTSNFYHPPPFKPTTPIYLSDRVFRI